MSVETQISDLRSPSGSGLSRALKSIYHGRTNATAVVQSLAVKVGVLGLNAATSIIVARALSPTGRGEMSAIIMWPGFFASLLTLGLPTAVTVELRKRPALSAQTIGAASLLALLIGVVTGVVGYEAVPRWLTQYSPTDILYARWVLLASPLPILLLIGRSSLEAAGDFLASNISLWAAPAITLACLLVLVLTGNSTPLACGLAYTLGVIPPAVFLLWRVYQRYHPRTAGSLRQMTELLHYGLRSWGTDLLTALAVSENVLVIHFLSASEMGTYVVVASLARMLSVFQTSVVTVLFPRIAARNPEDVISLTGFAFRITTVCAVLCAGGAGVLGPILLRAIYGARYAVSGTLSFRLLLGEVVLSGATQVLAQAYLALDRPGTITLIQASGVGVGLLMMPHLIKEFGAPGAPLALLASSVIRLVATLLGLRFAAGIPRLRLWLHTDDLAFVANRVPFLRDRLPKRLLNTPNAVTEEQSSDARTVAETSRGPAVGGTSEGVEKNVLKVAFLASRLDFNDGVASHIELLALQLVRRGAELTMITGVTTGSEVAVERCATLRRLFPRWHQVESGQLLPRLTTVRKLARILRHGRFDVIHVHGVRTLLLARMATLGMRIPLVTTYHPSAHGAQASDFQLEVSKRKRLFYRAFLEILRPSSLIALSSDTYDLFVRKAGCSPRRVRKIICGIDTAHFRVPTAAERSKVRTALGIDDETMVFVLPGRLNLNKGHDVVIAAFSALKHASPNLKLKCLFPGAGAQAAEIKALIEASPDPRMFALLGFVPDIRDTYWAADAAILPSRNEGFAIVVAEAMACGCVAIRTPAGGSSDQIVSGKTGYLVGFNSAEDIGARVQELCKPDVLQSMRVHAAEHAHAMFSAHRMGAETMELYRECAGTGDDSQQLAYV